MIQLTVAEIGWLKLYFIQMQPWIDNYDTDVFLKVLISLIVKYICDSFIFDLYW